MALAGSAVAVIWLPSARAVTSKNACYAGVPRLNAAKTRVVDSGYCVVNGKRVTASFRYGVSQADSYQNPCGKTLTGTGAAAVLASGVYKVTATFQAVKLGATVIRSKPVTKSFVLGSRVLQCGKLDPNNTPLWPQVCDYPFNPADTTDVCGKIVTDKPSGIVNFPMWGSRPQVDGLTVRMPDLLTPSGGCKMKTQIPASKGFKLMGSPIFSAFYDCPDGFHLAPFVYIYYDAPGSSVTTCSLTDKNIRGSNQLTQFTLPASSADWGGNLYVVWKMLIFNKDGLVAHIFSDKTITLKGNRNACPQLLSG